MSERVLEDLQRCHPDWRIQVLPEGSWMATRRCCSLTDDEFTAGLACTLMTDSSDDLRDELAEQRRIEDTLREPVPRPVETHTSGT